MLNVLRMSRWAGLAMLCFACDGAGCMPPEWGASALLHAHRRAVSVTPSIPFRELRIASHGVELRGWLFPSASPARGTVVSLHGVGDNRASSIGLAQRFTALGYDVLAYDSRGHGDSGGKYCTYGFYEKQDLKRMLDEVSAKPIILFGSSLGAAVALQAAAEDERIAGVISVAVFSDLRSIAEERAPFFAGRRDIEEALAIAEKRANFRVNAVSPLAAARRIDVPVLLIHGADDTDTAPAHSRRVHRALTGEKRLIVVPGVGHTGVITPAVWSQIDAWIERVMVAPADHSGTSALGFRFFAREHTLYAAQHAHVAPLTGLHAGHVSRVESASAVANIDSVAITVSNELACEGGRTSMFILSGDAIRARLEHARGLQDAQPLEAAIAHFARAVQLDPSFDAAIASQAQLYASSGRMRDAARALQPLITKNPLAAYVEALQGHWSLDQAPELTALHSRVAGRARIVRPPMREDIVRAVFLDPAASVAAVVAVEPSARADRWSSHLYFFDTATGEERLRLQLVGPGDLDADGRVRTVRTLFSDRAPIANRLLENLGFSPVKAIALRELEKCDVARRVSIPDTSIAFACATDRGTRFAHASDAASAAAVLGDGEPWYARAVHVPAIDAVIATIERTDSKNCDGELPRHRIQLVRLPPRAVTPRNAGCKPAMRCEIEEVLEL